MAKVNLDELQARLTNESVGWEAGYSSLADLSDDDQDTLLGAIPPDGPPSEEQKAENQRAVMAAHEGGVASFSSESAGAPVKFDWRNANGNYVTSVKNQGGCGSCVAFGVSASIESLVRIMKRNPNYPIDISEAHLFYCLKGDPNGCKNGWWPSHALNHFKNTGVALENYFPYVGSQQTCKVANGWQNQKIQITGWRTMKNVSEIKNWIAKKGPVEACYEVFADFYNYKSGVYKHVSGASRGWHCVCVVGYDDVQKCWICKNSWGSGWGDGGFFRIGYGQCSIEYYGMMAADAVIDSTWIYNKKVTGLWTINSDLNAWVYLQGEGWKKISAKNEQNFWRLLTALVSAKTAGTTVSVRIDNSLITQVYA